MVAAEALAVVGAVAREALAGLAVVAVVRDERTCIDFVMTRAWARKGYVLKNIAPSLYLPLSRPLSLSPSILLTIPL